MTHPLTDEICEKLQFDIFLGTDEDCMRAATDWQLERCITWLENLDPKYTLAKHSTLAKMMRAAMRPQVVDLPQANSDVCGEEGAKRALQRTIEENYEAMRKLSDS